MAKKIAGYIKLEIPAGQANPSPPVGPALVNAASTSWIFVKRLTLLHKASMLVRLPRLLSQLTKIVALILSPKLHQLAST